MTAAVHAGAPSGVGPRGGGFLSVATFGVIPFFVFALLFLILPTCVLLIGAFQDRAGNFTFANITDLLSRPDLVASYWISIKISAVSAAGGAFVGFFIARSITSGTMPGWVRGSVMTFSGVASNFAGVPLAFAFVATLGRVGLVTVLLRDWLGINLYASGFNLLSFVGLTLTYLYFQIPLMVLILVPALDGMKKEWREATAILGGSAYHYWRYVGIPVLWPSIMGAALLLFANAFGAVATAFALTGPALNIVTIQLFAQIRGDVLNNPNLGFALALGMVVITCISNGAYIWLRGRSERWLR
jgi:putative spermidine/putrescine transport system permease protein